MDAGNNSASPHPPQLGHEQTAQSQHTGPEAPQAIEADDSSSTERASGSDDDSAYGDEIASYTTSLSSTIMNYKYENGYRYHAQEDRRYYLPNDEGESDRLDLFHHLLIMRCDDRLHLAPIGANPQRILDLGTGTGIWAIQMGDAYPSAEILGNDLSPTQPNLVPPNVSFEIDDIENTWCFSQPFDYIHARNLTGSIRDWPSLMAQAFKFTKPGGWVEFQDFNMAFSSTDGTFVPGSPPDVWAKEVVAAIKTFGVEPEPGPKLEQWVRDAGFENVNHRLLPIPVGPWPRDKRMKEIGACDLSMFLQSLEALSLRALTSGGNWSREEVLAFLPSVRKSLLNRHIHALHDFHVVWAQKPVEARD